MLRRTCQEGGLSHERSQIHMVSPRRLAGGRACFPARACGRHAAGPDGAVQRRHDLDSHRPWRLQSPRRREQVRHSPGEQRFQLGNLGLPGGTGVAASGFATASDASSCAGAGPGPCPDPAQCEAIFAVGLLGHGCPRRRSGPRVGEHELQGVSLSWRPLVRQDQTRSVHVGIGRQGAGQPRRPQQALLIAGLDVAGASHRAAFQDLLSIPGRHGRCRLLVTGFVG